MQPEALPVEDLVDNETRTSLTKLLSQAIGVDITKITIPVSYNEPTSFIMRVAEATRHNYLLKIANQVYSQDPDLALLYVSMYSLSTFATAAQRVSKPFNPLLGETFDYVDDLHGTKFFVEQVSHHPPISAAVLESEHFIAETYHEVKTKFTGNSVEAEPLSLSRVTLKTSGAKYTYGGISSTCHCVLIGSMWLDVYGPICIQEIGSSRKCDLQMTECGWFSSGWHEVNGTLFNDRGEISFTIEGKWNESIQATRRRTSLRIPKLARTAKPRAFAVDEIPMDMTINEVPHFRIDLPVVVWTNITKECQEEPYCTWHMTEFARQLCYFDPAKKDLLPTDVRLRPDRIALEKKDYATAANAKFQLEEEQRRQKRVRDLRGEQWEIKYFEKTALPEDPASVWYSYKGNYWEAKEDWKRKVLESGKSV
eukprot:TRINITY_DN2023_c0_g2_i2.p1 TRINITY_DN2023_c0_g2~~TRINITY_DN2023_c0_g2_i2.p1  ORF type:complete len:424 (+),score=81.73 TRINITY_DN2023_c0_g2_i2:77-1348(+)